MIWEDEILLALKNNLHIEPTKMPPELFLEQLEQELMETKEILDEKRRVNMDEKRDLEAYKKTLEEQIKKQKERL